MRQANLFIAAAAAALILACVAGWTTPDTQARVTTSSMVQIDPFQVMVSAKKLPTERIADYSFVFADLSRSYLYIPNGRIQT
jgi:hypothetical protein